MGTHEDVTDNACLSLLAAGVPLSSYYIMNGQTLYGFISRKHVCTGHVQSTRISHVDVHAVVEDIGLDPSTIY